MIYQLNVSGYKAEAATVMNSGQLQQLGVECMGMQAILLSRCRAHVLSTGHSAGSSEGTFILFLLWVSS